MAPLNEYSIVRVKALLHEASYYDGWKVNQRSPEVGDIGTVVDIIQVTSGGDSYVVESTASDGSTTWLGDFTAEEIEPVNDADQPDLNTPRLSFNRRILPERE